MTENKENNLLTANYNISHIVDSLSDKRLDKMYQILVLNHSNWTITHYVTPTGQMELGKPIGRTCPENIPPSKCAEQGKMVYLFSTSCTDSPFNMMFYVKHPNGKESYTNPFTIKPNCDSDGEIITLNIPD